MQPQNPYFQCPYCAGLNTVPVDFSAGANQKLLTDCEVCCRPLVIRIILEGSEIISVEAEAENK